MLDLGIETPNGYNELGSGDRHGSEELTWSKTDDGMTRFITVATTPFGSKHVVEVWIGAEKEGRFTHRRTARNDGVDIKNPHEPPLDSLAVMMKEAAALAQLLSEDDLTEKRIVTLAIKKRIEYGEKVE